MAWADGDQAEKEKKKKEINFVLYKVSQLLIDNCHYQKMEFNNLGKVCAVLSKNPAAHTWRSAKKEVVKTTTAGDRDLEKDLSQD